jgi:hypothetical protein
VAVDGAGDGVGVFDCGVVAGGVSSEVWSKGEKRTLMSILSEPGGVLWSSFLRKCECVV